MNTIEATDIVRNPESGKDAHFKLGQFDISDFRSMMAEAENGKDLNRPEKVNALIEQVMSELNEKLESLFERLGPEIELPDFSQIASSMNKMGKDRATANAEVKITVEGTGAAPVFDKLDSQPVPVSEASVRADLKKRNSSPWSRYDTDNLPAVEAHLEQIMSEVKDKQKSIMEMTENFSDEASAIVDVLEQIFDEAVSKLEKLSEF